MNTRVIIAVVATILVALVLFKMVDRREPSTSELDRNVNQVSADVKEGLNDAKRSVEDIAD